MTSSNIDPVKVARIDWLKLLPVLQLVKAARMGIRVRVLLPSLLVTACLALGPTFEQRDVGGPRRQIPLNPDPTLYLVETVSLAVFLPQPVFNIVEQTSNIALGSGRRFRNHFLILTWNMLLVGVLGLAVARAAGTDFCAGTRTGAGPSLKYAINRLLPLLAASLLAILVAALFLGPVSLAGWVVESIPPLRRVVMLGWFLVVGLAVLGVLASVVCLSGWFLAIAAIGVDGCDGADALSRGINYTLSHKLATFFYFVVAAVVSLLSRWFVGRILSAAVQKLNASFPSIPGPPVAAEDKNLGYEFAMQVIEQLPAAVHWGTFMCGVTIVYVLLRQREDAVNLDQFDDAVSTKSGER